MGALNDPHYRIVVTDKRFPRDGRFLEEIGTYNPQSKEARFQVKLDRADHWISKGAVPSDTVRTLMKRFRRNAKAS